MVSPDLKATLFAAICSASVTNDVRMWSAIA
jgi:hypothetical protein